ncbi:MAG: hypothetical protein IJU29_07880 [Oscillospiraceae bacterium]|nr:hypothetical protein [Oscillospiraceae bacterium]
MRRTDRLTKLTAALLFLALLAYLGVYVFRALRSATVTAQAVDAEMTAVVNASGLLVREERVLTSACRYVDVTAAEGARAAAGSVLASASDREEALKRNERIRELETELARISSVHEAAEAAGDPASRASFLNASAAGLAAAAARHDLGALDKSLVQLETLLLPAEGWDHSPERQAALEQELFSLRSASEADVLRAPVSGVFSREVDGYEHLVPSLLEDLTPSGLRSLTDSRLSPDPSAYGKLAEDYRWYLAAAVSADDAALLEPECAVTLSFGRYLSRSVSAKVVSVSEPEGGTAAVVFLADTCLSETLPLRTVSVQVRLGTSSGVRVPSQAVRTDEETGERYVWAVTARVLERKTVEPLYTGSDYTIVRRDTGPDALRAGNTVVVSGEDLYVGKVMS